MGSSSICDMVNSRSIASGAVPYLILGNEMNNPLAPFDENVMKALSEPVRIELINILGHNEMCVQDIAAYTKISRPNVSHHLQILRRAGLVVSRKEGKEMYYSVNLATLAKVAQQLLRFSITGKL
jgi:ArsR family transcriptional regulator